MKNIFENVSKTIISKRVAKQFILEELDAASQGNEIVIHFVQNSGFKKALLSIMLGPVKSAGLGAITILTLGAANTQKSIPIVATVGAIRRRIKYEKGNKK